MKYYPVLAGCTGFWNKNGQQGGIVNLKKTSMVLALMLLVLLSAVPAWASGDGNGFMIGIFAPYNTFAGHFDGTHFFNTGEELLLVPKMGNAIGYGIAAGSRRGSMEWEMYYMHSSHDTSFELIKDKATFDAIGANTRYYFGRGGLIRPYGNMGMDYCWVTAQNASITLYDPIRTGSAKFSGFGLYGGLGLGIRLVRAVTLYVGGELRWDLFGRGKGVLNESHKLDKLNSVSLCLRSGLCFVI